ncbi:aminoacyl-tRNA deacylase [Sunxiuqinia elliptica]|uniref:Ala-tRNA(Pro) deacylase n=1 Tax=Sunxiuqinia elliptica TaxID=655355 RepID=A0A4V3BWT5_9BACT|nr:YbaK/EbsC family protein [Sunxiuqinia elliptica]TDN95818.1 Ala-tRNA(Pro) deacylase [Sunxiuqinia elliptica]TDO67760.1 Ala-tRNA(Pro) deacylase [Sunxiuqinia elliptica]
MPIKKLKNYLDENNIEYITIRHSLAFNAQRVAATTHIPGKELAKTVMIKLDGKMAMAVLPASYRVRLDVLKELTGAKTIELANEMEFKYLFPECEIGAMPPFGNLYDMEVFVAASLAEDTEIAFNAGTHVELTRMAYADFERLVQPVVLAFSTALAS